MLEENSRERAERDRIMKEMREEEEAFEREKRRLQDEIQEANARCKADETEFLKL